MADPYIGEIRIFGFQYAPLNWAVCNGATLAVQQNTALYSLIGATYGGDGVRTFQLPNLSSRGFCNVGQGAGLEDYQLGEAFGAASVTLTVDEIPPHNHVASAYSGGSGTRTTTPTSTSALSSSDLMSIFNAGPANLTLSPAAVTPAGGGQSHENRQPGIPLMFGISLRGVFPTFS